MLVVLRLCLGCHFLYEGMWKIKHQQAIGSEPKFSARPFLTQAKGPAVPLFHAMLTDYEGRQRLRLDEAEKHRWTLPYYLKQWEERKDLYLHRYKLNDEQSEALHAVLARYQAALEDFATEHHAEIQQHFGALERLEAKKKEPVAATDFQKKRIWDWDQELQKEVDGWLGELDNLSAVYEKDLGETFAENADAKQERMGALQPVWIAWNPLYWTRDEQINFAVTYGLTAIGLCLMLGFFTRLASLGGAAFMVFVLLTQPGWPTIYPPAPPVVGHALLVNKDFIELVALLLMASSPVGRWGGLDFFTHRLFGRRAGCGCGCGSEAPKA